MVDSCWVLTLAVNDYRQHGDYLVAVWDSKPSVEALEKHVELSSCEETKRQHCVNLLEHGWMHEGDGYYLKQLKWGAAYA